MNLATRIERLENAVGRKDVCLPDMLIRFVDTISGEDGRAHFGQCVKMLRIRPGVGQEWLDPAGNPIANPA